MPRGDAAVAAIVAGSAQDQGLDRAGELPRRFGQCRPGAFHQHIDVMPRFGGAHSGSGEDRAAHERAP